MRSWLKLISLYIMIGFSACTAFYTRQYTRGIYYDLSHHPRKLLPLERKQTTATALTPATVKDSLMEKPVVNVTDPGTRPIVRKTTAIRSSSGKQLSTVTDKFISRQGLTSRHFQERKLAKADGVGYYIGAAALYIVAALLAIGIIALAIYFLPTMMIPPAMLTAFGTLVVIVAIILLILLVILIYKIIELLGDLFRKKPREESL